MSLRAYMLHKNSPFISMFHIIRRISVLEKKKTLARALDDLVYTYTHTRSSIADVGHLKISSQATYLPTYTQLTRAGLLPCARLS